MARRPTPGTCKIEDLTAKNGYLEYAVNNMFLLQSIFGRPEIGPASSGNMQASDDHIRKCR